MATEVIGDPREKCYGSQVEKKNHFKEEVINCVS